METSNFVSDINVSCHRNSGILYISDSVKVSEFRDNWLTSLSQLGSCTLLDDNETAAKENEPFNYPQSLLDLPDIPEDLRKELAKKCRL